MFCGGSSASDYGWSTTVVLVVQAVSILAGTVAPAYRWFSAVSFRSLHDSNNWSCKKEFLVEGHWLRMLQDLKEAPFYRRERWKMKIVHHLKNVGLRVLIPLQKGAVILSKLVRLFSMCFPLGFNKLKKAIVSQARLSTSTSGIIEDLEPFVLRLQGESDLVNVILRSGRRDTEKWIRKGSREKATKLIKLITEKHSASLGGFHGARAFDSRSIPSLVSAGSEEYEPPNCWALPIVTLASIAVALKDTDSQSINFLLQAVHEGLRYVRTIEHDLDVQGLVAMRNAADIQWHSLYLCNEWLGKSLHKISSDRENNRSIITELQNIARTCVEKFWVQEREKELINNLEWPEDVLAANCMYRLASTILYGYENHLTDSNVYSWIETTVADILRACLTNLPQVIYDAVISSPIEVREENIRKAALLFGEAKDDIIEKLCIQEQDIHLPESTDFIDDWRTS